jgi:FAD/FMN-containing dehydrogenase
MDLGGRNWLGNIECFEKRVERPCNEEELIRVLKNTNDCPSPVRPMGSRHSMTACMAAKRSGHWGTAVDMRGFTKLRDGSALRVDRSTNPPTATIPAGRTFIEVARELHDVYDLTFNVITELGTLTVGAAACGATKDSSGTGEFGQVCHDVVGMRLVRPDGQVMDLTRKEHGETFEALCCSYGLFGIVTEVTFNVVPHSYLSLHHEEIPLERFDERTKELLDDGNALFLYLFPFGKRPRIIAEVRRQADADRRSGYWSLRLRNFFWRIGLHILVRIPIVRHLVPAGVRLFLLWIVRPAAVSPVDQIVDFRHESPKFTKFTFSMWAFPREKFAPILAAYFELCRRSRQEGGFHSLLPQVSYHIGKDRSSLLSYSYDSDVWSLDPIASRDAPGWGAFLDQLNEKAVALGGKPLLNQTPRLTAAQVASAYKERLDRFESIRRRFDPEGRMLNDYFVGLFRLEGLQKLDQRPLVDVAQGRTENVTSIYNEVGALAKHQQPVDQGGRPEAEGPHPR